MLDAPCDGIYFLIGIYLTIRCYNDFKHSSFVFILRKGRYLNTFGLFWLSTNL